MGKIYVADLSAYNAGIHHGEWIEIDEFTDKDDVLEKIREMLKTSPMLPMGETAEEWRIDGFEDFAGCESTDLDELCAVAAAIAEYDYDVVTGYLEHFEASSIDKLQDRYIGIYKSVEEYCEETIGIEIPDELVHYIDWKSMAQDRQSDRFNAYEASSDKFIIFSF